MDIEKYYKKNGNTLSFSRDQASMFAKAEAGDFNPIHNVDARRFCVPGDLLFSVALHCVGIYQSMRFEFEQIVTDAHELEIVQDGNNYLVKDISDKVFLNIGVKGEKSDSADLISELSRAYIQFSGITFPYLLVDLLRDSDVMIKPSRPLVMYKSMAFTLDSFKAGEFALDYSGGSLTANGKKATVELPFAIRRNGEQIGNGGKEMLLGGLQPYNHEQMDALVTEYNSIKDNYPIGS